MFSALKKLVGTEQLPGRDKNIPAGLQSMNQSMQRRFAKGVQYNMKILIRGDRNTGKTTLWHRLQGKKFVEQYIPTQEIQVTSIHWNYKTTDDIVKVEVWDVVDKGKSRKKGDGLKLENDPQESDAELALDAEFLDVYKNCNGVIMMFDITKQWTFSYIMKELPKMPNHIPVCVLGNHRDMGEHRVILPDDVREFIESLNSTPRLSYIRYAESSMRNGFGLKYLHKFFNIPFLQLQRETLLRQLETNQLDVDATLEELSMQHETEDQNYDLFLEVMDTKSRSCASPLATNGQSPSPGSQSPVVPPNTASTTNSSPGTPQTPLQAVPAPSPSPPPPSASSSPVVALDPQPTSPVIPSPIMPSPTIPSPATAPQKRSLISRIFGSSSTPETPTAKADKTMSVISEGEGKMQTVDDFVPEEALDRNFLEDAPSQRGKQKPEVQEGQESDSDGERRGNPMVNRFQDDLDLGDQIPEKPKSKSQVPSKDITFSSDEEDSTKVAIMTGEDIDSEEEIKRAFKGSSKSKKIMASTKLSEQRPGDQLVSLGQPEALSSLHTASHLTADSSCLTPTASLTTSAVAGATLASVSKASGKGQSKTKAQENKESSESDIEGPIAIQLLSFVMDDPDFESEEDLGKKVKMDEFPIREDPSEVSEDDLTPVKLTVPLNPPKHSLKPANDLDLFGLGFEEKTAAEALENNGEDKTNKHSSKDKKKKKKVKEVKEEEEKLEKKKHRHKKGKEKELVLEEEKKRKKKLKSKDKTDAELDDLEMFLAGGGDGLNPSGRGAGDYEEL